MLVCPECRSENPEAENLEDARTCVSCGRSLEPDTRVRRGELPRTREELTGDDDDFAPLPQRQRKGRLIGTAIAGVLVAGVVAGGIVLSPAEEPSEATIQDELQDLARAVNVINARGCKLSVQWGSATSEEEAQQGVAEIAAYAQAQGADAVRANIRAYEGPPTELDEGRGPLTHVGAVASAHCPVVENAP